jgi:hypothetical protein
LDLDALGLRCAHGQGGNWVCIYRADEDLAAGPCAFGPDGSVAVAAQLWNTLREPPPTRWRTRATLTKIDAQGAPLWARTWQRSGEPPALNIAASDMVIDAEGNITWAGQDCQRASSFAPADDGGYYQSCIDALVVSVDAQGTPRWQWSFGTRDGLERVSTIALGPGGGFYLGGGFSSPLSFALPEGHPPVRSLGSGDQFVLALDAQRSVRWMHAFGSPESDGDALRLATNAQGEIAAVAHFGGTPAGGGFVARIAGDGTLRSETRFRDMYIADVALLDEVVYTQLARGAVRLATDTDQPMLLGETLGWNHIESTSRSTLVVDSYGGDQVRELDRDGRLLREHAIAGAKSLWYQGGLCVSADGQVGVSSTIAQDSDFGILKEPLRIAEKHAFVLVLRDW